MIRHNGYYKIEPVFYEDGVGGYSINGFVHNAYWFKEDHTYISAGKRANTNEYEFQQSEFDIAFPNKYHVNGSEMVMTFHTGEEWEFTECFKIGLNGTLKSEKRELYFVPFNE